MGRAPGQHLTGGLRTLRHPVIVLRREPAFWVDRDAGPV